MYDEFQYLFDVIEKNMDRYVNSTPVITYSREGKPERFIDSSIKNIKDIFKEQERDAKGSFTVNVKEFMLLSLVAGENVLLIGDTGNGKTTLAQGVLGSIFGSGYAFRQIDNAMMGPDLLRDINFNTIKSGGTLSDAVVTTSAVNAAAILLDEINRADPRLLNFLQNFLDKKGRITLEGGKEVVSGVKLDDGSIYHAIIATGNVGEEYTGVYAIDKATKSRFGIVLNIDLFRPSYEDGEKMNGNGEYIPKRVDDESSKSNTKLLLALHQQIKNIKMDDALEYFLAYLTMLNNCYAFPEGDKGIAKNNNMFNPQETCATCPAANVFDNVCGNVFAISTRTREDLVKMTKAFAALRMYKDPESEKKATIKDLLLIAPFVLAEKMQINREWKEKRKFGSEYSAVEQALNLEYDRFLNSWREIKAAQERTQSEDLRLVDLIEVLDKNPAIGTLQQIQALYNYLKNTGGKGMKPELIRGHTESTTEFGPSNTKSSYGTTKKIGVE